MKVFARAIQHVRWICDNDNCFDLSTASSEALGVDMSCLGEELSVYEIEEPKNECLEKIAVKVFIDCLRNFKGGITLFLFTDEYLNSKNFHVDPAKEDNPFELKHYNIRTVANNSDLIMLANHIGEQILKDPSVFYDYSLTDILDLLCKYSGLCNKYKTFNKSKKENIKKLFLNSKKIGEATDLFN